jgi:hypothetical protein
VFRLLAGPVDETDQRKRRNCTLHMRLDFDASWLEADEGEGDCASEHTLTVRPKV